MANDRIVKEREVAKRAQELGAFVRAGEAAESVVARGNLARFELGDLVNQNPPKRGRPSNSADSAAFTGRWWAEQTGLSERRVRDCARAAKLCSSTKARRESKVDEVLREHRTPASAPVAQEGSQQTTPGPVREEQPWTKKATAQIVVRFDLSADEVIDRLEEGLLGHEDTDVEWIEQRLDKVLTKIRTMKGMLAKGVKKHADIREGRSPRRKGTTRKNDR